MSNDHFVNLVSSLIGPSRANALVTPSDTTDLTDIPRSIYVGGGGNIVLVGQDETSDAGVMFTNVPAGTLLPVRARRVLATGTTATDIIAVGIR